jgi:hypothetical protein
MCIEDALCCAAQALMREHKQRLYFAFALSRQHYGPEGVARAAELEPLARCQPLEALAAALNDMSYPAQRWQAWSGQLERLLHSGKKVLPSHLLPSMAHYKALSFAAKHAQEQRPVICLTGLARMH